MPSVVVQDDFSPMYVGDTEVPFAPVFAHKTDGSAFNLNGATITMKMQSVIGPGSTLGAVNILGAVKVCSGVWVIDDAPTGRAHYPWQTADVDTPGNWMLYVSITIGGQTVHGDPKPLTILPVP